MFSLGPPVLMARPHPFIEEAMSRFLAEGGFAPAVVGKLDDLDSAKIRRFHGAVISTSVLSHIKEKYLDVMEHLRRFDPELPIVFATMAPLAQMELKLEKDLRRLDQDNRLFSRLKPAGKDGPQPGQANCFFLLHKEDLTDPLSSLQFKGLLQAHFRPRA